MVGLLLIYVCTKVNLYLTELPSTAIVSERHTKINILPSEFRGEVLDLCIIFESRAGIITTDEDNYMTTFKSGYNSRS